MRDSPSWSKEHSKEPQMVSGGCGNVPHGPGWEFTVASEIDAYRMCMDTRVGPPSSSLQTCTRDRKMKTRHKGLVSISRRRIELELVTGVVFTRSHTAQSNREVENYSKTRGQK